MITTYKLVLSILFSSVCCFINAGQHCWNNANEKNSKRKLGIWRLSALEDGTGKTSMPGSRQIKNCPRTEHGCCTGAIYTEHTDFLHGTARLSVYTFVKAGTARLIGVPRPTYFVVLVTAKNLGTGAEAAPFTLSEFAVPCRKKAAPVPKY